MKGFLGGSMFGGFLSAVIGYSSMEDSSSLVIFFFYAGIGVGLYLFISDIVDERLDEFRKEIGVEE